MPTYKNVSSLKATVEGKVVEPGREISTIVYHNENEIGLLKTSDKPFFTPTLFSEVIEEDSEIVVPWRDNLGDRINKFNLHFYCEKGEVEIFYNSIDNLPSLKLYESAKWNNRYYDRRINKIFVKGRSKRFSIWIEIEKIFN